MALTVVAFIAFCAHVLLWLRLPASKMDSPESEMTREPQLV